MIYPPKPLVSAENSPVALGYLRQPQGRTAATWSARREAFHIIADTRRFHEQPD
jgi:hypothetical protein